MNQPLVCDTASNLGMKIDNEFIVVALSSGKFFHFTAESEAFFRSFHTPHRLESFAKAHSFSEDEQREFEEFCDFLLKEQILSPCSDDLEEKLDWEGSYVRPKFLRQGDKLLSQFDFSYP